MGKGTRNLLAMLQFAELWNGTGCADFGRINPYLYAGTNIYSKGKYHMMDTGIQNGKMANLVYCIC